MTTEPAALSVLDLTPVSSGSSLSDAVRNTIDLARHAEQAGYRRYWLAEHHLNPGVVGTAPAILIGAVASATSTIRVGSGAVQSGHRTSLSIAEEFGLLSALFPNRIDLGLGRSGNRRALGALAAAAAAKQAAALAAGEELPPPPPPAPTVIREGVVLPPPFKSAGIFGSPRFVLQMRLLQQSDATAADYGDLVEEILAFLRDDYVSPEGVVAQIIPGGAQGIETWLLGSTGGETAELAGRLGLPFAANYHVAPSGVFNAVEGYRAAFQPSQYLSEPRVIVSADVVVAGSDDEARELASPYAMWVRSIRRAEGAIPFPTPAEAARFEWTSEDRQLVRDRIDTQIVGSPATVVDKLAALQKATGADELLITTITHDHQDRVRSYELLAKTWSNQ
jgi:alkanesulfonate monooxygenase SsuD/methylene tetrahydromethanopterin reductase-like flavin-dependent oxidoreductase (luciferase family)